MSHTKTPWRLGHACSIVADEPVPGIIGSDDVKFYGGHLICESMTLENAILIVRAVNAHTALAEYFHACESLQMTMGHPEASADDENAAENRYLLAKVAARDALAAKVEAA